MFFVVFIFVDRYVGICNCIKFIFYEVVELLDVNDNIFENGLNFFFFCMSCLV